MSHQTALEACRARPPAPPAAVRVHDKSRRIIPKPAAPLPPAARRKYQTIVARRIPFSLSPSQRLSRNSVRSQLESDPNHPKRFVTDRKDLLIPTAARAD